MTNQMLLETRNAYLEGIEFLELTKDQDDCDEYLRRNYLDFGLCYRMRNKCAGVKIDKFVEDFNGSVNFIYTIPKLEDRKIQIVCLQKRVELIDSILLHLNY